MTKNITTIERAATGVTKAFSNIIIETKEDINSYMNIAETLTESAQFARAWVLNLAKENVFKGVSNETIKYADEKFGIKRASTLQYIKIAREYLVDATRSKLCGYYKDNKFVAFCDTELPENVSDLEVIDFTYTQIAVMMSKGYEEVRKLISDGTVSPLNTVAEIKKALKPTVEATFTDNASGETNVSEETETDEASTNKADKSKTVKYVDENNIEHTFDEITACDTDEITFVKVVGKSAFVIKAKLLELAKADTATVKVSRYAII